MRRLGALTLIAVLTLPVLPGCASKYGEQKTAVNYYPACYRPIQDLRDREHDVAKATAGGGIMGALGGALIGLLATGKWEGAVMGGAMGGVAGTVAGNIYASKQREADDNRRIASYLQDIQGDISNLDVVGAAARNSLECYDRQFAVLVREIKDRTITRDAAQARYAEIVSGREEAIAILGNAANHARSLDQEYEKALMAEQQQLQTPAKMAQGPVAASQKAAAINTVRKRKSVALNQTAASLETDKSRAQTVSSQQKAEMTNVLREAEDAEKALKEIRA